MDQPSLRPVADPASVTIEDLSDDDLMQLAKAGRRRAFEALVRRHQRLVLGLASRSVGDLALGNDIAQDVFVNLWAERARYQPSGRFRSYLVSMVLHRCKHQGRTHRGRARKLEEAASSVPEPAGEDGEALQALLTRERAAAVREKLVELPAKMRAALILRFTEGLSIAEISETTGAPAGTVKSDLFRGLRRLQRLLGKEWR